MTIKDNATDGFRDNIYFDRKEFACKCGCGYAVVDARLLEILTSFRAYFGRPMIITSGARCLEHNKKVGGAAPQLDANHQPVSGTGSQHLWGMAADVVVDGVSPFEVHKIVVDTMSGWGGVGQYREFTHIDVRPKMARWKGHGIVNYIHDKDGIDLL